MSSHKRVVDDIGLVHYGDRWWLEPPKQTAWCGITGPILVRKGTTRERVTCLLCLGERAKRGGAPGSLLPYRR